MPFYQTPQPQHQQTPSPAEFAHSISRGDSPSFAVNYQGTQNAAQSFQAVNLTQPGFGPNPQYLTPPQYGYMRQAPAGAAPVGQGLLPPGHMPFPTPGAHAMFTSAGDFAAQFALQHQRHTVVQNAAWGTAGLTAGFTGIGAMAGSALGAATGAMLGGPVGMRAGSAIGGIAGGAGMLMSGFAGDSAAWMRTTPIHDQMNAMRIQEASQRWYTGAGANGGQGMSVDQAGMAARELGKFADKTHGLFNRRDMMNIMQHAGDTGLLDFAGNSDKVIQYVKTTAKVVAALAKITSDPDIKNNIQLLADMQRMGVGMADSLTELSKLRGYQRASGKSFSALANTVGAAGAANFAGAGLSAGAGFSTGIMGAGMARMAMQTGAISPELAGLLGGETGIAQNIAQANAAAWNGNMGMFATASLLKKGANGELYIDKQAAKGMALGGGAINPQDLINQTAKNLNMSPDRLAQFIVQSPELKAQAMNALGAEGRNNLLMRMGAGMSQAIGISPAAAFTQLGLDPNHANMFARMGASPEMAQKQQEIIRQEGARANLDRAEGLSRADGVIKSQLRKGWETLSLSPFASGANDDYVNEWERQNELDQERGFTRIGGAYRLRDAAVGWFERKAKPVDQGPMGPSEAGRSWLARKGEEGWYGNKELKRFQGGMTGLWSNMLPENFIDVLPGSREAALKAREQARAMLPVYDMAEGFDPGQAATLDPKIRAIVNNVVNETVNAPFESTAPKDLLGGAAQALRKADIDPAKVDLSKYVAGGLHDAGRLSDTNEARINELAANARLAVQGSASRLDTMSTMSYEAAGMNIAANMFKRTGLERWTNKGKEDKRNTSSALNKLMKEHNLDLTNAKQVYKFMVGLAMRRPELEEWLRKPGNAKLVALAENLLKSGALGAEETRSIEHLARKTTPSQLGIMSDNLDAIGELTMAEEQMNLLFAPYHEMGMAKPDLKVGELDKGYEHVLANAELAKRDPEFVRLARAVHESGTAQDMQNFVSYGRRYDSQNRESKQSAAAGGNSSLWGKARREQSANMTEMMQPMNQAGERLSTAAAALQAAAGRLEAAMNQVMNQAKIPDTNVTQVQQPGGT
jgi:hypothetical protein